MCSPSGSLCFLCIPRVFLCHRPSCSQPSFCAWVLCSLEQIMECFSSSVSTAPSFEDVFSHNMWNPFLELLFLEQVSGVFEPFVDEMTWPRSHSLVILLLIYSATKKVRVILHEAPLGTIVHGAYLLLCGTITISVTSIYLNLRYLVHSPSLRQQ